MAEASGISEIEIRENKISEDLWNVLEQMPGRENVSDERRLKQLNALLNLPPDFDLNLKGHIRYGESVRKIPDESMSGYIDGELFEQLVRSDPDICPEAETKLGSTLRSVMNDPERFDALPWVPEAVRQPDMAHINAQKQIDYATEIKLTHINARGTDQIFSFRPNFKTMIETFTKIKAEVLRQHGLGAVAEYKTGLTLAPDFNLRMVFSYGSYKDEDLNSLVEHSLSDEEKQKARTALGTCTILESPFSAKEIHTLRDYLHPRADLHEAASLPVKELQ